MPRMKSLLLALVVGGAVVAIAVALTHAAPTTSPAPALVYTVTVPAELPYETPNPMFGKTGFMGNVKVLRQADGYLEWHRAAFVACVGEYLRGELKDPDPEKIEQMMGYEGMGQSAGRAAAKRQLQALEKAIGREKLAELLKAQGYRAASADGR